jgi:hypothetical protein
LKLKTILGWAAIALLVWFVVKDPTSAAHIVTDIGDFLSSIARGIASFLSSL